MCAKGMCWLNRSKPPSLLSCSGIAGNGKRPIEVAAILAPAPARGKNDPEERHRNERRHNPGRGICGHIEHSELFYSNLTELPTGIFVAGCRLPLGGLGHTKQCSSRIEAALPVCTGRSVTQLPDSNASVASQHGRGEFFGEALCHADPQKTRAFADL